MDDGSALPEEEESDGESDGESDEEEEMDGIPKVSRKRNGVLRYGDDKNAPSRVSPVTTAPVPRTRIRTMKSQCLNRQDRSRSLCSE